VNLVAKRAWIGCDISTFSAATKEISESYYK